MNEPKMLIFAYNSDWRVYCLFEGVSSWWYY